MAAMSAPILSSLHTLSDGIIDNAVRARPGVFVLDSGNLGPFTVALVGRADTDLNAALHQFVARYRFFKFAYCVSAEDAFEAECELYHDFLPRDNVAHPAAPASSRWKCPRHG